MLLGSLNQLLNLKRLNTFRHIGLSFDNVAPSSSSSSSSLLADSTLERCRTEDLMAISCHSSKPCGPQSSGTEGHHRLSSALVLGRPTPVKYSPCIDY